MISLKKRLRKLTKKDVQINIFEVKRPELDADLVGQSYCQQIEGRVNFKRAIKMAMVTTMRMGAQGVQSMVSGRLNGAEMARTQQFKEGRIPLHTLELILTMHYLKHLLFMVRLVLKYGF